MKTAIIISALLSLAYAAPQLSVAPELSVVPELSVPPQLSATAPPAVQPICACALPACPAQQPAGCECLQSAELLCWKAAMAQGLTCPPPTFTPCETAPSVSGYVTFGKRDLARPTGPPITLTRVSASAVPTPTCTCEPVACIQSWPESCICENEAKEACYQKCGGPLPTLQPCPISPPPSVVTISIPPPSPTTSYQPCGGLVATPNPCPTGQICIDDPFSSGCGMACDAPGICVSDITCGGLIGKACPSGLTCVDDPRDGCDPKNGGTDCEGLCV